MLLLGLASGLHLFRADADIPIATALRWLARPETEAPDARPNDAMVDPEGRLWFGTMVGDDHPGAGALHRMGEDAHCHRLAQGWTVPNGPALSPDGTRLYWTDSPRRSVFVFDRSEDGGSLENGQLFLRLGEDEAGVPDGMTVDAEGCLWVAHNRGGRVVRYAPDARRLEEVVFPVPAVSSCTFGGPDLSTLFVTTARQGAGDRRDAEGSGALFAVPTRIRGLPAGRLRLRTA